MEGLGASTVWTSFIHSFGHYYPERNITDPRWRHGTTPLDMFRIQY